jgi:hypothetical protein
VVLQEPRLPRLLFHVRLGSRADRARSKQSITIIGSPFRCVGGG